MRGAGLIGVMALALAADNERLVAALPRPQLRRRGPSLVPDETPRIPAERLAAVQHAKDAATTEDAERKRLARERKRMTQILAGGFGVAAQIEAWDVVLPRWRVFAQLVRTPRADLTEAQRASLIELGRRLQANRAFLAGPWSRLVERHQAAAVA